MKRIFAATTGVLMVLMATARAWPQAGAPAITSLSPSVLYYGPSALPVGFTVTGSGFLSGSQILFNGAALKTSFRSATQLSASLTLTPVPGNVALIAVTNPGGATSAPYEVTLAVNGPKVT